MESAPSMALRVKGKLVSGRDRPIQHSYRTIVTLVAADFPFSRRGVGLRVRISIPLPAATRLVPPAWGVLDRRGSHRPHLIQLAPSIWIYRIRASTDDAAVL